MRTDVVAFIMGLLAGGAGTLMFIMGCWYKLDEATEKRGIWVFRDRAYKLTRIDAEPPKP